MASKTVPRSEIESLRQALPVVLDAIAAVWERDKVRAALLAFLDDDAPAYSQRLAELLGAARPLF